jgi:lipopolysaccharide/colanic/teichoic acid biosynthesis glycosyltransferase
MKIWPVLLDSRPAYLGGPGRSSSLLLCPLGTHTILELLCRWLTEVTNNPPLVLPREAHDADYENWVRDVSAKAQVVSAPAAIADALASHELSDALLIVDPRCLPLRGHEFPSLARHYSEDPRVAHNLVSFEQGVAGTKESVTFDAAGHVREILRYYDSATWPFISSVAAMLVPVASGILADGIVPASLTDLRQTLAARGVPGRDIPMQGSAVDLRDEAGLLVANEFFIRTASTVFARVTPVCVGSGHSIHETARISGQVVIHDGARLDENVMVFGPAVIGAGARISAGAIVARAAVGPDCTVPGGMVVHNSTWFEPSHDSARPDGRRFSSSDRLPRLLVEARGGPEAGGDDAPGRDDRHLRVPLKRPFDVVIATLALAALSPLLLVVAVAVWLESKGPILYGDRREGLGGRVFRCWKFRTMFAGAHDVQKELKSLDKMDGPHFKLDFDPRVTRVGRVLRALNVDEIPQLFNVLIGEMSLVGPRPSPFRENQVCVPWRDARLSVRPGITGFWQVCRHDRSSGDFHQWIEYDLLYVQNLSFVLDLKILLATFLTLGGKAGHVTPSWLVSSSSFDTYAAPPSRRDNRARPNNEQVVTP